MPLASAIGNPASSTGSSGMKPTGPSSIPVYPAAAFSARTLRQAGYDWEVTEAADGAAALEIAQEMDPDLVLSDWNMPEMTGIELLRKLNALGMDIPLGFVTSEGSSEPWRPGQPRNRYR